MYPETPPPTATIPLTPPRDKKNRPHDEVQGVNAYYSDNKVILYFESYDGMATTTIINSDTGNNYNNISSTATQPIEIYIGNESGYYTIYIETSHGSIYEGNLQL